MALEDEENYQNSNDCWICNRQIFYYKNKVRDHCHITGKYRGASQRSCNSKLKLSRNLPTLHIIYKETMVI